MSYDAVNQMIAQYQSIDVDGNHIEQRVIIDYKQVGALALRPPPNTQYTQNIKIAHQYKKTLFICNFIIYSGSSP